MVINTKFAMFQIVKIIPIETSARIMKIVIDGNDISYIVEYWHDGLIRSVQLMELDLEECKSK